MPEAVKQTEQTEISREISVPPDSPWFSGHFPGEPILPGIAQLQLVFDAIRDFLGEELTISSLKRVRFKQIIRPDDRMKISIKPDEKNKYSFTVTVNSEISCSGIMTVMKSGIKEINLQ